MMLSTQMSAVSIALSFAPVRDTDLYNQFFISSTEAFSIVLRERDMPILSDEGCGPRANLLIIKWDI
jgi:hypothetical protein